VPSTAEACSLPTRFSTRTVQTPMASRSATANRQYLHWQDARPGRRRRGNQADPGQRPTFATTASVMASWKSLSRRPATRARPTSPGTCRGEGASKRDACSYRDGLTGARGDVRRPLRGGRAVGSVSTCGAPSSGWAAAAQGERFDAWEISVGAWPRARITAMCEKRGDRTLGTGDMSDVCRVVTWAATNC
jgi:hypothetical protein